MFYESWEAKYKPRVVAGTEPATVLYGTSDEDLEILKGFAENFIWTEVDNLSEISIEKGLNEGEAIGYFVTEIPWNVEDEIFVSIGEYIQCGCRNDEDEVDPSCDQCYGDGHRLEWMTPKFQQITPSNY